jgi:hypothetical protein
MVKLKTEPEWLNGWQTDSHFFGSTHFGNAEAKCGMPVAREDRHPRLAGSTELPTRGRVIGERGPRGSSYPAATAISAVLFARRQPVLSNRFTIMRSISNIRSGEPSELFVRPRGCAAL